MLKYISFFVLIFTSLLGIFSIANRLSELVFTRTYCGKGFLVIPLKGKIENIENVMSFALKENIYRVVVLNLGLDPETVLILEKLLKRHEGAVIVTPKQFADYVDDVCKRRE